MRNINRLFNLAWMKWSVDKQQRLKPPKVKLRLEMQLSNHSQLHRL